MRYMRPASFTSLSLDLNPVSASFDEFYNLIAFNDMKNRVGAPRPCAHVYITGIYCGFFAIVVSGPQAKGKQCQYQADQSVTGLVEENINNLAS